MTGTVLKELRRVKNCYWWPVVPRAGSVRRQTHHFFSQRFETFVLPLRRSGY